MIFNMTGGGGSNPLNFQVKTYPSETALKADNPKENTIGIITTTTMTSWVFSAKEPTEPEVGMVWISVGTSSPAEFNALKENNVTVYPLSAKQMVSGTLKDVVAKTFHGGKWVNWWSGEIIDGAILPIPPWGQMEVKILLNPSATSGVATAEMSSAKGGLSFYIPASSNSWTRAYLTPQIDLTGYSRLTLKLNGNGFCPEVGFVTEIKSGQTQTFAASVKLQTGATDSGEFETTIDISTLNGLYYFCLFNAGSHQYSSEIVVYKAILS